MVEAVAARKNTPYAISAIFGCKMGGGACTVNRSE
jgi:hypothetical protein